MMENMPPTTVLPGRRERVGGAPGPSFKVGTEVAQARRVRQPGFEEQLSLLEPELELKKKLKIALIVILSVFFVGLITGAVLGIFV